MIPNVNFGKYHDAIDFINQRWNNICDKIIGMANDIGPDPYDRSFDCTRLLEFAVDKEITHLDIDHIYRYFVYDALSRLDSVNKNSVDELLIIDVMSSFKTIYEDTLEIEQFVTLEI